MNLVDAIPMNRPESLKHFFKALVTLASLFEATRELFWNGLRYFQPLSNDEDATRACTPYPNIHTTPAGDARPSMSDLSADTFFTQQCPFKFFCYY
ncbi:hypothetical protein AVEN_134915-1 [Araneus ventricosus]|uniref:Uncharacterized protein n=1 Tax=Araneus ventricosus TaxID=182803 RepID=A0A4Y2CIV4_ARAVE|nr:hypothetical protein AVEN_134915-1 [Araneus ventricosus]